MNAQTLDKELLKLSLSPIAPWLDDPEVTDILVYGSRNVYVRRRGSGFEGVAASWLSDADLMTAAKTIGRQMARRLDSRDPILDARLPDKSRVNIIVDPCYHRGACIAIRKFPKNHFTWEQLIGFGSIDQNGVAILEAVLRLGQNILRGRERQDHHAEFALLLHPNHRHCGYGGGRSGDCPVQRTLGSTRNKAGPRR